MEAINLRLNNTQQAQCVRASITSQPICYCPFAIDFLTPVAQGISSETGTNISGRRVITSLRRLYVTS